MVSQKLFNDEKPLFSNADSLEPDFVPPQLPHREAEMKEIMGCVEPLLYGKSGKNLFICGSAGLGKTHVVKHILRELSEQEDAPLTAFVNCWLYPTSLAILRQLARLLRVPLSDSVKDEALIMEKLAEFVQSKGVVLVFDEVDKAEDVRFLYMLLDWLERKSIILITNRKEWLVTLDDRVRSRLMAVVLEFEPYTWRDVEDILKERRRYAFYEDTWEKGALAPIVDETFRTKDMRVGIALLREAGVLAEKEGAAMVSREHVKRALAQRTRRSER
jgi:cell division control protein 6